MGLIEQIMKDCGETEVRAKSGVGLILRRCKAKLSAADYAKVAAIVPDSDILLRKAPTADVPVHSTWAVKILPSFYKFIQSKGGDEIKNLVDKALFAN